MNTAKSLYYVFVLGCLVAIIFWLRTTYVWDEFFSHWDEITYYAQQHIALALGALLIACAIALPIGIVLSRPALRGSAENIIQLLNIGATVPTLAVLALAMLWLGLGDIPALFALVLIALLPIARNTYSGLIAVPPALIESAKGMGMTPTQTLFWVELPNALFVIVAGIRVASVITIGTVPLAFVIGGGGLGALIFAGIDLADDAMMLAGAIPTAVIAVLCDVFFAALMFFVLPRGVNPTR